MNAEVNEKGLKIKMRYTIKKGDTLSAIAKNNNTTVEQLAKVNKIANPNLIYAGNVIEIPEIGASPVSSSPSPISASVYGAGSKPQYSQSSEVKSSAEALKNFEKGKPAGYESKYEGLISELLDKIMNRESFSYDFNADPLYRQYRDRYIADGRLAMKDTVGEASSLTGGYANSYAASAANSAYNSYLQRLSDVIPSLMDAAYRRYRDRWSDAENNLSRLMGLDESDYSRYRDTVSDYNDEWDRLYREYSDLSDDDYGRYLDMLEQWNADRAYERGVYEDERDAAYRQQRDAVADSQWEREMALAIMKANSASSSSGASSSSSTGKSASTQKKSSTEMTYAKCGSKARGFIDILSSSLSYDKDGHVDTKIIDSIKKAKNMKEISGEEYKFILSFIRK